ncbi:MAG: ORF6N domain-containing protein [Acidovorax sp.]|uniref:ORF6N domain-containing protein n=1 Tax=Acidovorax sp. TaxID=1872122 RepID=UPI002615A55C|nr:ORF6N domain-containing protein [Acidovorax sp.]MDH4466361.1 ORF6N domain-containing protein [Acidovorax sp.]
MSSNPSATPAATTTTVPALQPHIALHILSLRGQRVMLDADLAALYRVETKVLVQAIKRNSERVPHDFMFQLDAQEWVSLRSQFVTSNTGRGAAAMRPMRSPSKA